MDKEPLITSSQDLPLPDERAVFFENDDIYACLASHPLVKGHSLVVWRKKVSDLHLLPMKDFKQLMDTVDRVRNALMKVYQTDKVYLLYMDEINHVHWHLLPRTGGDQGYTLLEHEPKKLKDFSLVEEIRKTII